MSTMNAAPKSAEQTRSSRRARVIGILGGGQLGRMSALAAGRLRLSRSTSSAPEQGRPGVAGLLAATPSPLMTTSPALKAFAESGRCGDLRVREHPGGHRRDPRRGEADAARARTCSIITQERLREKRFLAAHRRADVTAFREVTAPPRLLESAVAGARHALRSSNPPSFGYDGKGQVRIDAGMDLIDAWEKMGGERRHPRSLHRFRAARSRSSSRAARRRRRRSIEPVEQPATSNHILDVTSMVPARVSQAKVAHAGRSHRPPHRDRDRPGRPARGRDVRDQGRPTCWSTNWRRARTIPATGPSTAAVTSQFEQYRPRGLRPASWAIAARHSDTVMTNLIGDEVETAGAQLLADPAVKLHLYGKAEARPGRKMGHWNKLTPKSEG